MMRSRRGATLLELLVVLMILGVLVRIAIPRVQVLKDGATASKLIGAISVVRTAAFQYSEANNRWPPTAGRGRVPAGLSTYLPSGFTFNQREGQLAWQLLTVGRTQYGLVQAYPTTASVCAKLYAALGGSRNPNIAATCTGRPRVDFYVDR